MDTASRKLIQYLTEAHAMEQGLARELQAQILVTPSGRYRTVLERHHDQTREHGRRLRERLNELGAGQSALKTGLPRRWRSPPTRPSSALPSVWMIRRRRAWPPSCATRSRRCSTPCASCCRA